MALLILGILLFLGAHSLPIAQGVRAGLLGSLGDKAYRGVVSVLSLVGFGLIAYGFHLYRAEGWVQVWTPPVWTRHLTITLMWFAFVALAATSPKPGRATGRIGGWLRHPMVVAIKIWALAHLLANGDLGGMILFLSFLAWAVVDRISLKKRGNLGIPPAPRFNRVDAITLGAGTVAYLVFLLLHPWLIGVAVLMR